MIPSVKDQKPDKPGTCKYFENYWSSEFSPINETNTKYELQKQLNRGKDTQTDIINIL